MALDAEKGRDWAWMIVGSMHWSRHWLVAEAAPSPTPASKPLRCAGNRIPVHAGPWGMHLSSRLAVMTAFCRGARGIPSAATMPAVRESASAKNAAARPITGQAVSRRRIESAISRTGFSAARSTISAVVSTAVAKCPAPKARAELCDRPQQQFVLRMTRGSQPDVRR